MRKNDEQQKNKKTRIVSLMLVLTLVTTCLLSSTLAKYTKAVHGADSARVAKFAFGATVSTESASGVALAEKTATATDISLFKTAYENEDGVETVESDGTGTPTELVAPGTSGYFTYAFTGTSEVATRLSFNLSETNTKSIPIFYEYMDSYYANAAAIAQYSTQITNVATTPFYINVSDSDDSPIWVTIDENNYGGALDDLAVASAEGVASMLSGGELGSNDDIIPALTNLANLTPGGDKETTVTWHWPFEVATANDGSGNLSDTADTALGVDANTSDQVISLTMDAKLTQVD